MRRSVEAAIKGETKPARTAVAEQMRRSVEAAITGETKAARTVDERQKSNRTPPPAAPQSPRGGHVQGMMTEVMEARAARAADRFQRDAECELEEVRELEWEARMRRQDERERELHRLDEEARERLQKWEAQAQAASDAAVAALAMSKRRALGEEKVWDVLKIKTDVNLADAYVDAVKACAAEDAGRTKDVGDPDDPVQRDTCSAEAGGVREGLREAGDLPGFEAGGGPGPDLQVHEVSGAGCIEDILVRAQKTQEKALRVLGPASVSLDRDAGDEGSLLGPGASGCPGDAEDTVEGSISVVLARNREETSVSAHANAKIQASTLESAIEREFMRAHTHTYRNEHARARALSHAQARTPSHHHMPKRSHAPVSQKSSHDK